MKKLRTTLFVCLTALAVLTAFGCKQEAAVGDDVKAWKYQDEINEKGTLQIVVDKNGPVKWAVVVDEYNRIVRDASGYVPVNSGDIAKAPETVNQTQALQFEDLDAGKYTVYVYQPGVELEANGEKGTAEALKRDLRGTVTIKAEKGVSVKISNYAQHVPQVGLITITNTESASSGKWKGNYGIKSIKAVEQDKKTNKWVEVSGYTVTAESGYLISDATDKSNNSKTILFPAGEYHVAVNQPDRVATNDDVAKHITENWSTKPFPGEDTNKSKTSPENVAAYRQYQKDAYWIDANTTQKIPEHETAKLSTSALSGYLSGDGLADGGRYAAPAVYEIVEAPAGER
ncbi:MAG: hypothetical protein MST11_04200 [Spirochaetia bacterium]|nr:hypothetical protein [Spirochaetia bacterium]